MPTCDYEEDGALCGEPATRRIVLKDDGGEKHCCNSHFMEFAQIGNSVYALDGTHAPHDEEATKIAEAVRSQT